MNFLKNRRFQLESLEERTLLTAVPWGATADDPAVTTMIVVTDAVPVTAEVDDPSVDVGEGANVITEANPGDSVFVSVYFKSTTEGVGVQSGYCTLYFDNAGFTPVQYYESVNLSQDTIADGYQYSTDEYISAFGGNPVGMQDAFGQYQWALVGTQEFTVNADASGEYTFSNGMARNAKGAEKESWNFIREDYPDTFNQEVEFTSMTFTVQGAEIPEIEGVTVTGIETVYDGGIYSVAVAGLAEGDAVAYSLDGEAYDLEYLPSFSAAGSYTTYVKVSRENYQDWYGSADVVITPADITDVTVTGIETVYDGGIYSVAVAGLAEGDAVAYSLDGEAYDLEYLPSFSAAGSYTTYVKVSRENYNDWYGSADVVIAAADITDVTVSDVEVDFDYLPHTIEVAGLQEGDVVTYTYAGIVYEENPEFYGDKDVDSSYEVTVTVSRENYNDFSAVGTLTILASDAPLPGSLVVDTLEDVVDATDEVNSLREAIAYAETLGGDADTITFAEGLTGTITLAQGALVINSDIAIDGTDITIDASGESRIFEVSADASLAIEGFALTNGYDAKYGGAIYNAGELTLTDVAITASKSDKFGGAVYTAAGTTLTVDGSVFAGNTAASHAGAIFIEKGAEATIADSVFTENSTQAYGAALYVWTDAIVSVETSLFIDNVAPNGTIRNHGGALTLASVVIAGNDQGLASSAGVNVGYNVTISNNTRSAIRADEGASFEFYNSIVFQGTGKKLLNVDDTVTIDGDCNLSTFEFGTNFIAYNGGDLFAEDGFTLVGDNQAFQAGNEEYVVTETDALGNPRVYAEAVDLGAVEQICGAVGNTVVFSGSVPEDLVTFDGPVTWAMYSEDGENWSDEYTYRDAGDYTFYVWCGDDYGDEATYLVTATILPLQLTVEGSTVNVHPYDGTTNADVVVGEVATLYDDVTVSATGEFASAEIGFWDVAVSYSVSGAKAGNYIAPADETLTGEIRQGEDASMVVTTTEDVVDVFDGLISVREALTVYYGTDGCTTVTFAEGLGNISVDSTIELSRRHEGLVIDGGEGAVFDGGSETLFQLTQDANITFKGLTFQNINTGGSFGTAFACGWGMQDDEWGKTVTFDGCSFLNNSAVYGSVMMVTGTNVDILNCTFTGNTGSDRGVIWSLYNNLYVGGSTFENNSGTGNGGALFVDTEGDRCKDLMVKDSTFINNSTTGNGGAIYSSLEVLKLYNCTFKNNHADGEGGAVYATHWGSAYFSALTPIKVTLKNDVFEGNSSSANGGAIMVMAGNIQDVGDTGSVFKDNYTAGALFNRGGAIYFDYGTGASNFNGTQFLGNHASGDWAGMGGAVFTSATGFGTATDHQFNFNDCVFDGNLANPKGYYYAYGGAVYVGSGYNTFTNCTITNNAAYIADDSTGGGEVRGGAIYMIGGPDTRFYNCTLTNNYVGGNAEGSTYQKTQALGGAVYVGANALHFVQCQVTDNVAYGDNSRGGGVYVGEVGSTIWWSTVAGNSAAAASDVYAGGAVSGLYSIIMDTVNKGAALGYTACLYNSVEDATGTFTADANCYKLQEGDSLFNLGGYTLAPNSVAINGTGQAKGWFETDLNGDPRVSCFIADYGAFEYQQDAAVGTTVVFNGQAQAPVAFNGPATWAMYSTDGENWTDEPFTRDAGEYTFYVWCGDDLGNEWTGQVTGTIAPMQLTVEGSTVKTHGYDGTTDAEVVVGTVATLYDDVTVSATGEFASAEIGTWDVAVSYSVSGAKAGNYIAPADETLQGVIKAKEAPSMVVTTADDVVDATDDLISLREALTVYYGTDDCTTVTFAEGLTTINVASAFELDASYDGLEIDGAGAIVFDGENFTIFQLSADADLTFKGLTFQNINSDDFGGAFKAGWGCQDGNWGTVTFDSCTFQNMTGSNAAIMLFTGLNGVISNCTFTGNTAYSYGLIWDCWGNVTVEDSTFENNVGGAICATANREDFRVKVVDSAFTGNTSGGNGAAIQSELGVIIEGSTFTNNSSNNGGAVQIRNTGGAVAEISDSTFTGNTAGGAGGALFLEGITYSIDGCTFTGNTANGSFTDGGAIYINYGGDCTISDTVFDSNVATGLYAGKGGAIHFNNQNGSVVITDSTFVNNQAYAPNYYYGYGGAICRESGSGTLSLYNCSVVGNTAEIDGTSDNQASFGGGIMMQGSGVLNLVQCLIADNAAICNGAPSYGGGLFISDNIGCAIYYCTIAGNSTSGTSNSTGGGIFNSGATTVINSLIAHNEVPADNLWDGLGADIWQNGGMAFQGVLYDPAAIVGGFTTDDYCYALQEGDVLFNQGDYTLAPNSVAIDGTSRTTPPFNSYLHGKDLAGNPRVSGFTVDYGAFEFQYKLGVVVTLSDTIPNEEISVDMPVSTIANANAGDVVYAQVWVKNMDGSLNSLSGGYVDVNFTDGAYSVEGVAASSLFGEMADLTVVSDGVVADFGGLASLGGEALGVDSWALLGTITLTALTGEGEIVASAPTKDGVPYAAYDMAREVDGSIAPEFIAYKGASISVTPAVPADLAVVGAGANRHAVSWSPALAAQSYVLAYTTDGENWTEVETTDTSLTISGLTYGANVTYKVKSAGGDWSDTVTLNVCPMDINGDGSIDQADYSIFKAAYFSEEGDENWNPAADIDGDGFVGPADYSFLRKNFMKEVGDDDIYYPVAGIDD